RRSQRIAAEILTAEIHAAVRDGPLLVQRRPCARLALIDRPVLRPEPLRPQVFPWLAAQRIVVTLTPGRQAQHLPRLAVPTLDAAALAVVVLGQDRAGKVVLMPPGLNQDDRRARLEARQKVIVVRVQRLAPDRLAVRLLAPRDRIVDDAQVATAGRQPTHEASGVH